MDLNYKKTSLDLSQKPLTDFEKANLLIAKLKLLEQKIYDKQIQLHELKMEMTNLLAQFKDLDPHH